MQVREDRYEDLSDADKLWLRDQHPRGAAIIAAMKSRDQDEEVTAQEVVQEQREEVPPYEQWSLDDLRNEAAARQLSTKGNQATLAKRLNDHDAAEENKS